MSDQDMEVEEPPADPSVGLATALIVLTTVMLLVATFATLKLAGDRYNVGILGK